jgi:hypothetical protein
VSQGTPASGTDILSPQPFSMWVSMWAVSQDHSRAGIDGHSPLGSMEFPDPGGLNWMILPLWHPGPCRGYVWLSGLGRPWHAVGGMLFIALQSPGRPTRMTWPQVVNARGSPCSRQTSRREHQRLFWSWGAAQCHHHPTRHKTLGFIPRNKK